MEYLLAQDGTISFLEVNTRLQVEHPITEETSGVDLVLAQLQIAAGGPLPVLTDPTPRGHSFEFRINAEDVGRGFLPCPGTVATFTVPTGPGIRVDSGVKAGGMVPAQFDSLLAKLIVTGADRQQALRRARRALAEFEITGLPTVLPFHRAVVVAPAFTAADRLGVHTGWIQADFAEELPSDPQFNPVPPEAPRQTISIEVDGRRMALGLPAGLLEGLLRGMTSSLAGAAPTAGAASSSTEVASSAATDADVDPAVLRASMGGSVVKWMVASGAIVAAGDPVLVLEAMKMESIVVAHRSGTLRDQQVQPGDTVAVDSAVASISD